MSSVSHSVMSSSVTAWTVAHQAPLSMGFSSQEHWSELPFSFPGDLPDPGIEPGSLALPCQKYRNVLLNLSYTGFTVLHNHCVSLIFYSKKNDVLLLFQLVIFKLPETVYFYVYCLNPFIFSRISFEYAFFFLSLGFYYIIFKYFFLIL